MLTTALLPCRTGRGKTQMVKIIFADKRFTIVNAGLVDGGGYFVPGSGIGATNVPADNIYKCLEQVDSAFHEVY